MATALTLLPRGRWHALRRRLLRHRRALAAALAAMAVVLGLQASRTPTAPTTPVLVAARDLPSGTVLSAADLVETPFSPATLPAHVVRSPAGRMLAAPVARGEPIVAPRLVGAALGPSFPGLVSMPVRLPDPDAAALLRVGDRIDLIAATPRGSATVVARDVPVVALPESSTDGGAAASGGLSGRIVVVGVAKVTAPRLAVAGVQEFLTFTFTN